MVGEERGDLKMHRFNPDEEPATILLEANPRGYFTVARVSKDGKVRSRPDGKDDVTMVHVMGREPGPESRAWVPPRIAQDLTGPIPAGRGGDMPPVARVVGNRTVEEAAAGVEPGAAAKGPARKKAG